MDNEDGGDAEIEFPFLRFVPEEVHPQECADTASCDRHPDEIYDDCSQVRRVVTPINPNLTVAQ